MVHFNYPQGLKHIDHLNGPLMGHLNGVLGITNFSNILQMTGDGIVKAGSKVQVTFHRSRVHCSIDKVPNHTLFPVELKEYFVKRIGLETLLMLFIYLYLGNLPFRTCSEVDQGDSHTHQSPEMRTEGRGCHAML